MSDDTTNEPKALTFEEALEQKKLREAHGHGTESAADVAAEQLELSNETVANEQHESKLAAETNDDTDRTTNIPH